MNLNPIKTTCPYCGVGCGVLATVVDAERHQLSIKGDPEHPANFGRLCSKGSQLADTVSLENRLLYPEVDGQVCDWDTALDTVAKGFSQVIKQHGPDAVAFYVSGQLLTEDYYVANKLMKGYIGSANIDTNSRLCMSSAVVGYKRAFGADAVPCNYEDIDHAELIVLIGSNTAWCHPVAFQRIRKAKETNPALKIVVIDPRQTASCDIADLHLALKPGTDVALFNGLLAYLADQQQLNQSFIDQYCQGFTDCLSSAKHDAGDLVRLAEQCGLALPLLSQFYRWFAETPRVLSIYSQGINQSSAGTDKCNAIINCHLATGKIGQAGMGPFSFTGQPNAMGGREVGGLASMLAAHLALENPAHRQLVKQFWDTDNLAEQPGLAAVALFDAIDSGQIKAVWIMGTNPVVSMPDADRVKTALENCPFVVVSDCIANTDTAQLAKVKLPATGWSEKDGSVTNLERRISRQRALFKPSAAAKPDWWIISQVAQRMGFKKAFQYQSSADIFREHAALSGFGNQLGQQVRNFDISAYAQLTDLEYEQLPPRQWPINAAAPHGTPRLFSEAKFYTNTGKAQFIAISSRPVQNPPCPTYPYTLNTGRIRDQWHTMTRTGLATNLNQHQTEPLLEIHPADAEKLNLKSGELANIASRWGEMLARVTLTPGQQIGSVFVAMHWTAELSSHGRVGALVNPAVDPYSGQPESKQTPVSISPWPTAWQAILVSRLPLTNLDCDYWVKTKADNCWLYFLAGTKPLDQPALWASQLHSQAYQATDDYQVFADLSGGDYRYASFDQAQLRFCLFMLHQGKLPEPSWLRELFSLPSLSREQRLNLLSGKPDHQQTQSGRTVCACFNVGENSICQAIQQQKLQDVTAIGQCLQAGTGCGSCLPELKSLLNTHRLELNQTA